MFAHTSFDGLRVLFQTTEQLVAEDTASGAVIGSDVDGASDVYGTYLAP